jgi:rod shape-determining protein MreC
MVLNTILKNKRLWVIVIIIAALFLAITVSKSGRKGITGLENSVITVVKPLQKAVFSGTRGLIEFVETITQIGNLKEENLELKKKLSLLESDIVRLKELELENQRLREMLNFKEQSHLYEMEGAKVIGRNPGNWFETILIDKGQDSGIAVNMAVVTDKGLVGRVIDTGRNWSKVLLIIDQRSAVSGMVQRTRDNGVIKGQINPIDMGNCKMIYLPTDANILPGDLVISSGLGGIFPKGLIIGKIIEIKKEENELLKYAVVRPSVDFQRLEEVFVIKSTDTSKVPGEEK